MKKSFALKEPPLGLVPKFIRQEQRLREVKEAICRYMLENYPLPEEWIFEYHELCEYVNNHVNNQEKKKAEDKVWPMYNTGKWTMKQISDKLGVKLLRVNDIISGMM